MTIIRYGVERGEELALNSSRFMLDWVYRLVGSDVNSYRHGPPSALVVPICELSIPVLSMITVIAKHEAIVL